jgi:hypothetical protein
MEREGYLSCVPGRGTFVSSPKKESKMKVEKMRKLLTVVDDAIARAKSLGFSPEEFSLTLYARTQTSRKETGLRKIRTLFIECNRPQTELFSKQLKKELSIQVDPMLIEDFKKVVERSRESLKRYALIITTFYHIREAQALLAETGIEVVGLMVNTSLEALMRLTSLPEDTKVGVACIDGKGSENLKLSIERAGLKHLRLIVGSGQEKESLRKMVKEVPVVVCSSLIEKKIRGMASQDKEVIVDERGLDPAGIEMLRSRLMGLVSGDDSLRSL